MASPEAGRSGVALALEGLRIDNDLAVTISGCAALVTGAQQAAASARVAPARRPTGVVATGAQTAPTIGPEGTGLSATLIAEHGTSSAGTSHPATRPRQRPRACG